MAVTLLALLAVVALVLAAGWRWGGLGRAGLLPLAAALMLGAAGYAWEGRPGLAGSPTAAGVVDRPDMEDMMALRDRLGGSGRFSSGRAWLVFADGRLRAGRPDQAAGLLLNATRRYPRNRDLQTALAFALIAYADDSITPAAELALERVRAIDPASPVPDFLLGEAAARADRLDEARALWSRLLARSPPDAAWRDDLLVRLELLRRIDLARSAERGR